MVKVFINAGIDPSTGLGGKVVGFTPRFVFRSTPLFVAFDNGNREIAYALLKAGAHIDGSMLYYLIRSITDSKGFFSTDGFQSELDLLRVILNHTKLPEILEEHQKNPDNPFFIDIITGLVLNMINGESIAHIKISQAEKSELEDKHVKLIEMLLNNGVDPDLVDRNGESVRTIAQKQSERQDENGQRARKILQLIENRPR